MKTSYLTFILFLPLTLLLAKNISLIKLPKPKSPVTIRMDMNTLTYIIQKIILTTCKFTVGTVH